MGYYYCTAQVTLLFEFFFSLGDWTKRITSPACGDFVNVVRGQKIMSCRHIQYVDCLFRWSYCFMGDVSRQPDRMPRLECLMVSGCVWWLRWVRCVIARPFERWTRTPWSDGWPINGNIWNPCMWGTPKTELRGRNKYIWNAWLEILKCCQEPQNLKTSIWVIHRGIWARFASL